VPVICLHVFFLEKRLLQNEIESGPSEKQQDNHHKLAYSHTNPTNSLKKKLNKNFFLLETHCT